MLLSQDRLREYFVQGCKRENDLQIGVEWEKLGVYKDTAEAIPYSGPKGVERILEELVKNFKWRPIYENSHIVALAKDASSITLEPGGQLELSGQKALTLDQNAAELKNHLWEIKQVSEPLGITWLGLGLQPISAVDAIEWVPKRRYEIMRNLLKGRGELTYSMMKKTASIQISLDFLSEKDAIFKFRTAMGLSPFLFAMFANSPISNGVLSGFHTERAFIWANTDPARAGIIERVFDPHFSFYDYVDHVLNVPMFFIIRDGNWLAISRMNFKEFIQRGYQGHTATWEDWQLHLTTIFTDVRLKQYIEIRCIDCQRTEMGLSAPAFIKGLFYDASSLRGAWDLVADLSLKERLILSNDVAKSGVKAKLRGKPILEIIKKLIQLSEKGLQSKSDVDYLKPLKNMTMDRENTPADLLIDCFKKATGKKDRIDSLVRCASI